MKKIELWECDFCGQEFRCESEAGDHAWECTCDPTHRGCGTCIYLMGASYVRDMWQKEIKDRGHYCEVFHMYWTSELITSCARWKQIGGVTDAIAN